MKYRKLFLLLAVMVTGISCLKVKNYPATPEVQVMGVNFNPDSTATLVFHFTDGDGDIGLADADTNAPYNPANKYYNNLFVKYFEKVNGNWVNTAEANYRVQPITPKGKIKVLEGEIEVKLFYNQQSVHDTIKYSVQLVDKALHESNVSESNAVVKP
jgi:hypothetical protein